MTNTRKIKKAVFPVAGFGTRFLPATKAMPKELLPIVDGPDISKYGVVVANGSDVGIAGLVEKPDVSDAPSNLASIGRYVLTPDIFETLRGLSAGSGREIRLADAINIHAQRGSVETICSNGKRFDCGSVDGFMRALWYEYQNREAI